MNTTTIPTVPTGAPTAPTRTARPPAPPRRRRDALLGRHAPFLLYAVIGVGALVVDVGIYWALAAAVGWHPLLANTISTLVACIVSFLANSFVNFKVTDRLLLRFLSFAVVAGIGYVASSIIIGVGVGILALDPLVAKAISLPVVLVLQFTLNSRVTFKSHRKGPDHDSADPAPRRAARG